MSVLPAEKEKRTVANAAHQEATLFMVHREVITGPTRLPHLPGVWDVRDDGSPGLVVEATSTDGLSADGTAIDGRVSLDLGATVSDGGSIAVLVTPNDHGRGDWVNVYDYAHTDLAERFRGIESFPTNPDAVFPTRFQPADGEAETSFRRVLDGDTDFTLSSPGAFVSRIGDREYHLEIAPYAGASYVFFTDGTSGTESYGVSRVLVFPQEDLSTVVRLDFNDAKLPPCAINEVLSCPLPPAGNRIAAPLRAGQKKALFDESSS